MIGCILYYFHFLSRSLEVVFIVFDKFCISIDAKIVLTFHVDKFYTEALPNP